MKHVMVSLKDAAAQTYGPPNAVPSPGVALRSFENEVNRADEKNALYTNPSDFELYAIGEFDDETGLFRPYMHEGAPRPNLIARAMDVRRAGNPALQ